MNASTSELTYTITLTEEERLHLLDAIDDRLSQIGLLNQETQDEYFKEEIDALTPIYEHLLGLHADQRP